MHLVINCDEAKVLLMQDKNGDPIIRIMPDRPTYDWNTANCIRAAHSVTIEIVTIDANNIAQTREFKATDLL